MELIAINAKFEVLMPDENDEMLCGMNDGYISISGAKLMKPQSVTGNIRI